MVPKGLAGVAVDPKAGAVDDAAGAKEEVKLGVVVVPKGLVAVVVVAPKGLAVVAGWVKPNGEVVVVAVVGAVLMEGVKLGNAEVVVEGAPNGEVVVAGVVVVVPKAPKVVVGVVVAGAPNGLVVEVVEGNEKGEAVDGAVAPNEVGGAVVEPNGAVVPEAS